MAFQTLLSASFTASWRFTATLRHNVFPVSLVEVVSFISDRIQQWYRNRKTFCKYQYSHDIETLLHSAGGHQGSRKAHQADNQKTCNKLKGEYGDRGLNCFLKLQWNINTNGYLLWHSNTQQSSNCRVQKHCALDISRSYFFKDHTKTHPIARRECETWGVVRECKVWSKLYHCICCSLCNIML